MVSLKLDHQFLGYPVIEHDPLKANSEVARVRYESLSVSDVSLGIAARAREVFNHRVGESCLQACIQGYRRSCFSTRVDRDGQQQALLLDLVVLDSVTCLALQTLLELKVERIARIHICPHFLLVEQELFEEVREVLASVLLLARFEFLVTLANKSLKDGRSDSILVVLILLLFFCLDLFTLDNNNSRCHLLLRVFTGLQTEDKLGDLALHAVGGSRRARHQVSYRIWEVVLSELRQVKDHLNDGVHVTGVAKIFHSSETGSEDGHQSLALFEYLRQSKVEVGFEVHLCDRLFGLGLRSHIYAKDS